MAMKRAKQTRRKLAAMLAAGMCFQSVQCGIDTETLLPELIQTVGSLFITDYINSLFGVTPSPF
jgi:hypothetical protein